MPSLLNNRPVVLCVLCLALCPACNRGEDSGSPSPSPVAEKIVKSFNATATWYDVPIDSLAARRAGPGEFTGAHNTIPIGSEVRVTNLANHRSVLLRITDRGLKNAHQIDLCKEAAAQIGILKEGKAKVRVDVLQSDAARADNKPLLGKGG